MKKILLCYFSNDESNSIISSTISQLELTKISELTVKTLNVDKFNIVKYLNKQKESRVLPDVIYIYQDNKKRFKQLREILEINFPEIHLEYYSKELIYKPSRVPGNKLKTKVYILHDRLICDYMYEYTKLNVYLVNLREKSINIVKRPAFNMLHPMLGCINCYVDKKDAIKEVKKNINIQEDMLCDKISSLEYRLAETELTLSKVRIDNAELLRKVSEI